MDSFRYEREREMTLDTTRAVINLNGKFYEFIDVPGHKELIKNMLMGASDAKYAILVIDIIKGITPQTLRHLEIAKFLGIKKLIIAINKLDKIKYSRAKYEKALKNFSLVLLKRGFDKKQIFIPVSAFTGGNLLKKTARLKWFKGPTLANAIQKTLSTSHSKKPKGKLIVESGHASSPISKLAGFKKIHELQRISIEFNKTAALQNNFVIKRKGRIIGICKLAR